MSAHPNNPLTTSETDAAGGQVSGQTSSQVDGQTRGQAPKAHLYRMMIGTHVCPFGLKAKHLLKSRGFEVEDHPLLSRESFSSMFLGYDLLARRWVPYSYLYPFLEGGAGILMLAGCRREQ